MTARKRALLLAIGAAGAVAALSGAVLEGCVAIGFAVETYLVCCAYLAPSFPDDEDDEPGDDGGGGGGDGGPDLPPDPWPDGWEEAQAQAYPPGLATMKNTATATSPAATSPTV